MKILILFCDMLRANRLKMVNKNISDMTPFDNWLVNFGGCTYSNCYTPAPDTPRSLACFYTGLYPKINGCRLRIEWPKYYQNLENPTIFQLLKKLNYKTYTNFSPYELETGILTSRDLEVISNFESFLDIFNSNVINKRNKNSFFFLTLNDYNKCVYDYSSLKKADRKGHEQLINTFNIFFKKYDKDIFDYIFIFSDHGCVLSDDNLNFQKKYNLLNDNRSKIFLHIRKKGEASSQIDSSLRTIMDIYPSIADILDHQIPKNINGKSLFNPIPHEYVVIEDSCDFKPYLGMYNDIWRYKEKNYSYYCSINNGEELKYENMKKVLESKSEIDIEKITKRIEDISFSYKEVKKRNKILNSYSEMHNKYSREDFSLGKKRDYFIKIYFYKNVARFLKTIKIIFYFLFKSFSNFKNLFKT